MIRLRQADETDRETFLWLRRQIEPELTRETHEAWWHDVQEHRFVADEQGKPVGVIRLGLDGTLSFQVAEQERGQGYGRHMLIAIQEEARALGYTVLQARVDRSNLRSQDAFLMAGYAAVRFEVTL